MARPLEHSERHQADLSPAMCCRTSYPVVVAATLDRPLDNFGSRLSFSESALIPDPDLWQHDS